MRAWKKFYRSYGEYSSTSSNVKKTTTSKMFLNRFQAQTCCLMCAGSKCHTRFNANDQIVVTVLQIAPWRGDYKTPDAYRLPCFLPLAEPIAICDLFQ